MITKIEDNGKNKCEVYFPDPNLSEEVMQIDDDITVRYLDIDDNNHFYQVRSIEVESKRLKVKRIVNHFWVNFTIFNFFFLIYLSE